MNKKSDDALVRDIVEVDTGFLGKVTGKVIKIKTVKIYTVDYGCGQVETDTVYKIKITKA